LLAKGFASLVERAERLGSSGASAAASGCFDFFFFAMIERLEVEINMQDVQCDADPKKVK
jgi:hypothetical protein